jgi:hypothetical protein
VLQQETEEFGVGLGGQLTFFGLLEELGELGKLDFLHLR